MLKTKQALFVVLFLLQELGGLDGHLASSGICHKQTHWGFNISQVHFIQILSFGTSDKLP